MSLQSWCSILMKILFTKGYPLLVLQSITGLFFKWNNSIHHFYCQLCRPEYPGCMGSIAWTCSYSGWGLHRSLTSPCTMVSSQNHSSREHLDILITKGGFRMQSDMSSELLHNFILCFYAAFIKQWCSDFPFWICSQRSMQLFLKF